PAGRPRPRALARRRRRFRSGHAAGEPGARRRRRARGDDRHGPRDGVGSPAGMNPAAAAAALALAAAAVLCRLGGDARRRVPDLTSRGLAAAAGILLLFAVARPAARPAAVLAFAAAAVAPRGLSCLLAAAGAVVAAVQPAPPVGPGFAAWPLVAALALALAASALQEAAEELRSAHNLGAAGEA